ncbi:uncharacterized protein MONBRDRAFT_37418 [Monosiga brevicollis MX1]|uniref:Uncharacterized protein n=1 Tax=Monosiga brevicollis TaxID=81824 RepID=A9V1M0_MONBE|nr:uncharacterized protein MONBRDRAFT_37418 [Monosiga brevicollis MX1]EDQ88463.1 predicted protein [Monosiga brevicollis MX1]|eukprot:XP_001746567.1 hypothetical protein [Monosiga brevicollis MX1]
MTVADSSIVYTFFNGHGQVQSSWMYGSVAYGDVSVVADIAIQSRAPAHTYRTQWCTFGTGRVGVYSGALTATPVLYAAVGGSFNLAGSQGFWMERPAFDETSAGAFTCTPAWTQNLAAGVTTTLCSTDLTLKRRSVVFGLLASHARVATGGYCYALIDYGSSDPADAALVAPLSSVTLTNLGPAHTYATNWDNFAQEPDLAATMADTSDGLAPVELSDITAMLVDNNFGAVASPVRVQPPLLDRGHHGHETCPLGCLPDHVMLPWASDLLSLLSTTVRLPSWSDLAATNWPQGPTLFNSTWAIVMHIINCPGCDQERSMVLRLYEQVTEEGPNIIHQPTFAAARIADGFSPLQLLLFGFVVDTISSHLMQGLHLEALALKIERQHSGLATDLVTDQLGRLTVASPGQLAARTTLTSQHPRLAPVAVHPTADADTIAESASVPNDELRDSADSTQLGGTHVQALMASRPSPHEPHRPIEHEPHRQHMTLHLLDRQALQTILWIERIEWAGEGQDAHVYLSATHELHPARVRVSISHVWPPPETCAVQVHVHPPPGLALAAWSVLQPYGSIARLRYYQKQFNAYLWYDMLCMQLNHVHQTHQRPLMSALYLSSFTLPLGPNGEDGEQFLSGPYLRRLWTLQETLSCNLLLQDHSAHYDLLNEVAELSCHSLTTRRILMRMRCCMLIKQFLNYPSIRTLGQICARSLDELLGSAISVSGAALRSLLQCPIMPEGCSLALALIIFKEMPASTCDIVLRLIPLTARLTAGCQPPEISWTPDGWYLVERLRRLSHPASDNWVHAAYGLPIWGVFGEILPMDEAEAAVMASKLLRLPCIHMPTSSTFCSWPFAPAYALGKVPWGHQVAVRGTRLKFHKDQYQGSVVRPVALLFEPASGWLGLTDDGLGHTNASEPDELPQYHSLVCVQLSDIRDTVALSRLAPTLFSGRVGPFIRYALALQYDEAGLTSQQGGILTWISDGMPGYQEQPADWFEAVVI